MISKAEPNNKSRYYIIVILFLVSYLIFLFSVGNRLGTHIPKGITADGQYVPHDYYTGFPTQMPFKIIVGIITSFLLVCLIRMRHSTIKTLLLLPVYVLVVGFIGMMVAFFLFWEF